MGEINPRLRQLAGQFPGVDDGRTMAGIPMNMFPDQAPGFGLAQAGGVIGGNQHHFMPVPGQFPQQGFNENADPAADSNRIFQTKRNFHHPDV